MRRRRWMWLVAALLLFGVAAFLMSRDDPERAPPVRERVELPRRMKPEDRERAKRRRVLPVPATTPVPGGAPPPPERPRDPVLAALPSTFETGVVVVEANAIRHSPVGELLIECLTSRDDGQALQRFRERSGIDPLEDLDRVAVADETLVLSGHFQEARWADLLGAGGRAFGERGTLYDLPGLDGGIREETAGVWGDQLLVIGRTAEEVQRVLDRLEGRGLYGPPALGEHQTYGEIYGVLSAGAVADIVAEDQPELADKLRQAAERIELHVDARGDVGIVANVTGPSADDARDLGKTLGAALAVGRSRAQVEGDADLAELLDLARVVPGGSDFRVEMGLPLEVMQKHLRRCVERNRARRLNTTGSSDRRDAAGAPSDP